jgi:large repetitive protein
MEFRDTDLRTSLKPDREYEELGYRTVGFQDGDKVYITLPGGQRETFIFNPKPLGTGEDFGSAAIVNGVLGGKLYKPSFDADKGVTSTLTVPGGQFNFNLNNAPASSQGNSNNVLLRNKLTNKVANMAGRPYRPEDIGFGNTYLLTTKDGTVYDIDATTGKLRSVTDTNGNTLTYTDNEISSSTGQKVTFDRDAQGRIVAVTDPLGQKIKYEYDAKGDLVAVTDRDNNKTQYQYNAGHAHYLDKIIDPLGREAVKTEYDEKGRLKKTLDVNGQGTSISYDPSNYTETVLDAYGKPTTYVYDKRGNILQEIDALGNRTQSTYDEDNNKLSETDADGVTTKYTYDSNRNITSITDGNGNVTSLTYGIYNKVTSVTSPTGLTSTVTYDDRGNLLSNTDTNGLTTTFTYNANGRPLTQTNPDGRVLQWSYDAKGNLTKTVDSHGNQVDVTYDDLGQIGKAISEFVLNGQTYNLSTNYTYDREGRVLSNSNSKGNTYSSAFNSLGQLTSKTDDLGNIVNFKYDEKGQLIEQVLPDNTPDDNTDNPIVKMEYDLGGRKVSTTSPTGLVTRYIYDELGRIVETIVPDETPDALTDNPRLKTEYTLGGRIKAETDIYGNREEYVYNNLGQKIQVKDVLGNVTKFTYDRGGKVISMVDPRNRQTAYQYDAYGRLSATTYFDNTRETLTYDSLNRVKTETNSLGQTTTYEYDKFGQTTAVMNANGEESSFEYDLRGNLVKITDALGHITRHEYDQYARKVATIFADSSRVTFSYDRFDRVTATTDENTRVTKYSYDRLNQLIKIEQANGAETKYGYDNFGRLISTTDPNRHTTTYGYDRFDRTTSVVLPMGQSSQTVYDKYGQVTSSIDFNGDRINYGYDRYGRLTTKSFTNTALSTFTYAYDSVSSQITTVRDGRGVTNYGYDSYDRLASVVNPDGKSVNYGYDVLGNLTSLQTQAATTIYSYDKLNRLDTVEDGTRLLADYDYDAVGNLTQAKMADGSTETRNYDSRDRLTQITTKNSVGYTFSGFTYTLDAVGNRLKVVENNGRSVDYQYDVLDRLTQEQITDSINGNRTLGYTYDTAGNRLTKADSLLGSTAYIYDANNRLTQTSLGQTVTQFTYDNNGSMTKRTDGTNTVIYGWANDGENRLLSVSATNVTGTTMSQYIYDAMGSRVASITDGVKTNYLIAGSLPQVVMEYDASGAITADYTQGLGLIRSRRDGREGFYHTDALGSTRVITDNVGLVLDRYSYDAFGAVLNQTNTFANSFQFAGEQRDGTNLDYLRARYYDPSLGRFLSKDPFAGSITDPYSQHSYQYAHANPVKYTDPTGYFTMGDVMATISMIGTLTALGGTSFGAGYILGAASKGEDVLPLFGEWAAGFASGTSGGFFTDVYEASTGNKIKPQHNMLYQSGNVAGIGVSLLLGMRAPTWVTTQTGPLKWTASTLVGLDLYGAGKGAFTVTTNFMERGNRFEWSDTWNLLSLIPFAGTLLQSGSKVKNFLAANKALQQSDNLVQEAGKTTTKAGNCFVAGTEISTIEGEENIEDIQVGDWVLADDPNTPGEIEYKQVTDTFVRHTDKLVDLYIDGEVISTTGEHPFWTPDKGWVEAKDLVVGSLVLTEDGRVIDVDRVEKREGDFTVYNFKVESFHTYFVSDLGILVHNAPCNPTAKGFNWDHIMDRHSEWGGTAKQSSIKDIFYGLTENQIKKTVKNAWKNREKIKTQVDQVDEITRIKYRGLDQESGYIVEIWFNQNTKTVESAYPVGRI